MHPVNNTEKTVIPYKIRINDGFCEWEYELTDGTLDNNSIEDIITFICKHYGCEIISETYIKSENTIIDQ